MWIRSVYYKYGSWKLLHHGYELCYDSGVLSRDGFGNELVFSSWIANSPSQSAYLFGSSWKGVSGKFGSKAEIVGVLLRVVWYFWLVDVWTAPRKVFLSKINFHLFIFLVSLIVFYGLKLRIGVLYSVIFSWIIRLQLSGLLVFIYRSLCLKAV